MSLNIGIIGLPNVGKSTTFNALTKAQNAEVASYPFCTIEPNQAIVPVPDDRPERLAEVGGREQVIHATIEFVDIAGLVEGASKGEGLGNQFLSHIRDVDAIVHVVRCFEDANVAHVAGELDPERDIQIVRTELALADVEQLDRKIERLEGEVKGNKDLRPRLDIARDLRDHLATGAPLSDFSGRSNPEFKALDQELRLLSAKPVLYVANVDEEELGGASACARRVQALAEDYGTMSIALSASFEQDLIDVSDRETQELLELAGIEESGLEQVIRTCYDMLGLISFFTMNEEEVRAWTIPRGTKAPQAAGRVHTDFERGFIRAEVIPY
ncbi:MAG: redox-regulated ATPase YchF, partial [Anaerolineales bacterium]|nr:redox-regulated ATPase YchF [Anaerolineales bacterium]